MKGTVYLVDDDSAVRDALSLLLKTACFTVETYASGEEFLAAYRPTQPGCLVLDVKMPGMNGPELQAELIRRGIDLPVIFLTAYGDIPLVVRTIKGGATDFLTKPANGALLIERVEAALADVARVRQECGRLTGLSERECQVLKLAMTGLSNKEIARRLGISHRTVEVYRARILQKSGATNLLELIHLLSTRSVPAEPFEGSH